MSADFVGGYISGAIGIVVGNPLDLIKVRLQAHATAKATGTGSTFKNLTTGTAAPILGYGALNALLFVSYNRTESALNQALSVKNSLLTTWAAGALGGLATWVVSTPTEIIKCRAQISPQGISSQAVARQIFREQGARGFYFGGVVTALRDSIGYGFYFWSYELASRNWPAPKTETPSLTYEASKVLLCGGLAGIVTWASVFPLDVIKTRVQTQAWVSPSDASHLLDADAQPPGKRTGAWQITRDIFQGQGVRPFFRGFTVCCARAFIVNAVQWSVYEWIMRELGQGRK